MSADTELRDAVPQERADAPGDPAVAAPRSSRRRDALIIVVALLVGLGAVVGFGAITGSEGTATPATIDADVTAESVPLPERDGTVPAGAPAASPTEAVERFLAAEVDGDFEASYALLTEAQREAYVSPAFWTNAHADFFPIAGFRILEAGDGSVTTEVEYRSSLDEVIGLVPSRASVVWSVVEQDGGWLVDFDAAAVEPLHPDDAAATEAVADWVETHRECRQPDQYEGALVASGDLVRTVESLCDSTAGVTTSPPRTLDEFDASPFVSAFGSDVLSWARAVDVGGPVELSVVVAPVDDRWLVIGLLPPT